MLTNYVQNNHPQLNYRIVDGYLINVFGRLAVPHKHKFYFWLAFHGRLNTKKHDK
jgi:hypothetical protein